MPLLSKKDVCTRLDIALSTLNNWIDPNNQKYYKSDFPKRVEDVGGRVKFSEEQIEEWISRRTRKQAPVLRTDDLGESPINLTGPKLDVAASKNPNSIDIRTHELQRISTKKKSVALPPDAEKRLADSEQRSDGEPVLEPALRLVHRDEGVTELFIDIPPQLTMWDLVRPRVEPNSPPPPSELPSSLYMMFSRVAREGSTVSQSGAFSSQEVANLLYPSDEMGAMLDAIDLHSFSANQTLLTAVIYDQPSQCTRLWQIAQALGIHDAPEQLLGSQREKLFRIMAQGLSPSGTLRWTQHGNKWKIGC